jgi:putative transposase
LQDVDTAVAAGDTVEEVCRRLGVSDATYYLWRKRYGCMATDQLKRLKALERENARIEKEIADLSLDNTILKEVLRVGKTSSIASRRRAVRRVQDELGVSERRACAALSQSRCTQRYDSRRQEADAPLIEAMKRLSKQHPQFGYRRVMALLRAEGWSVNHKRVYRLWRQEGIGGSAVVGDAEKEPADK